MRGRDACEGDATGAPEAYGICDASTNACVDLDARTHAFDLASKAWLLPHLAHGPPKHLIRDLIRDMTSPEPEDRPNLTSALRALRVLAPGTT